MPESERSKKVAENNLRIIDEASKGTDYTATVKSLFDGNNYYLFVYQLYRDVRLVGAPPSSIGKFGGDTDNWMWPRHTGDFSLFRVYTGPDGKSADFSMENIPLKAKTFLPVSLAGVKKDDFSMILGYPGSTNRFLPSFGVKQAIDIINPSVVKIREAKLAILKESMDKSNALKIKYAAKYYKTSNYWKYFTLRSFFQIFMLQGLLMLIISTPVWFINSFNGGPLGLWDSFGLLVFGAGFLFEVVADYQLAEFKKNPENQGKIINSGLWSISRHPNYFGESLVWLGISFYAMSFPYGWCALISPVVITLLLRFVSGVPLLEKKYKNHPDWADYQAKTAAFVPFVKFL